MEHFDTVQERLQYILEKEGHTTATFARKSGVADQTLRNYLAGKREPRLYNLIKIVNAVDWIDANWLLMGETSSSMDYQKEMKKLHTIINRQSMQIVQQADDIRSLTNKLLELKTAGIEKK